MSEVISVSSQSSPIASSIFATQLEDRRGGMRTLSIEITAGTATVVWQGRNGPNDGWNTIRSDSNSTAYLSALFPQMQADITSASGATVKVTLDADLTPTS